MDRFKEAIRDRDAPGKHGDKNKIWAMLKNERKFDYWGNLKNRCM